VTPVSSSSRGSLYVSVPLLLGELKRMVAGLTSGRGGGNSGNHAPAVATAEDSDNEDIELLISQVRQ
jgi:hypothetical protein